MLFITTSLLPIKKTHVTLELRNEELQKKTVERTAAFAYFCQIFQKLSFKIVPDKSCS